MNVNYMEIYCIIGFIGGMSWEFSVEYYWFINQGVCDWLGLLCFVKLFMYSVDFGFIELVQYEGCWDDVVVLLEDVVWWLQDGGVDGVLLCINIMYKLVDCIVVVVCIFFLYIVDLVVDVVWVVGYCRLGLLGICFIMEQFFMCECLQQQGLEVMVLQEVDCVEVYCIIYEELCVGWIWEELWCIYQCIMVQLVGQGVQVMVLGCMEISLLVQQVYCFVFVLDIMVLYVEVVVDFVLMF